MQSNLVADGATPHLCYRNHMKSGNWSRWSLVVGLATLPAAAFAPPGVPSQPEPPATLGSLPDKPAPVEDQETLVAAQKGQSELADAPVSVVSSAKPLPPHIRATGP